MGSSFQPVLVLPKTWVTDRLQTRTALDELHFGTKIPPAAPPKVPGYPRARPLRPGTATPPPQRHLHSPAARVASSSQCGELEHRSRSSFGAPRSSTAGPPRESTRPLPSMRTKERPVPAPAAPAPRIQAALPKCVRIRPKPEPAKFCSPNSQRPQFVRFRLGAGAAETSKPTPTVSVALGNPEPAPDAAMTLGPVFADHQPGGDPGGRQRQEILRDPNRPRNPPAAPAPFNNSTRSRSSRRPVIRRGG